MPLREGVRVYDRKIRAKKRSAAKTTFYRIKKRIQYRKRGISLRGLARLALLARRRSTLTRRR
jgi:hypothetical protein